MVIQVLAPITYATPSLTPTAVIDTDVDLALLNGIGLAPSADAAHGWFDADDGVGEIGLLYRDASVVAVDDWSSWTGQSSALNGWYVLTHETPIPTEWFYELEDAGIDCFTFMPPNGFQCELKGHSTADLEKLDVEGLKQTLTSPSTTMWLRKSFMLMTFKIQPSWQHATLDGAVSTEVESLSLSPILGLITG